MSTRANIKRVLLRLIRITVIVLPDVNPLLMLLMATHEPEPTGSKPARGRIPETAPGWGTPPRYSAEQLFAGARQLIIVHGEREYCLRLTATNKLILTA